MSHHQHEDMKDCDNGCNDVEYGQLSPWLGTAKQIDLFIIRGARKTGVGIILFFAGGAEGGAICQCECKQERQEYDLNHYQQSYTTLTQRQIQYMYRQIREARSQQINPLPKPQSKYYINNSFHCSLQPKRISIDIKLYLQLHKKLLRKAIIEQKFEQNLNDGKLQHQQQRIGFVGNAKHQPIYRRKLTTSRQKRIFSDKKHQIPNHLQSYNQRYATEPSIQQICQRPLTGTLKPKTYCNRKFKKRQNFNRTDNQFLKSRSINKKIDNHSTVKTHI